MGFQYSRTFLQRSTPVARRRAALVWRLDEVRDRAAGASRNPPACCASSLRPQTAAARGGRGPPHPRTSAGCPWPPAGTAPLAAAAPLEQRQRPPVGALLREGARQHDRVLERELRARADREVRGVQGIAEQDDAARHASARSEPAGSSATDEVLRQQRLRRRGDRAKTSSSKRAGLRFGHPVEVRGPPRGLAAFDDEGAGRAVELVGMRGIKARSSVRQRSASGREIASASPARCTCCGPTPSVGRNDGLMTRAARGCSRRRHRRAGRKAAGPRDPSTGLVEPQIDAELAAPVLEHPEESDPGDSGKTIAANSDPLAAMDDVDVVPFFAGRGDRLERRRDRFRAGSRTSGRKRRSPTRTYRPDHPAR